MNIHVEVRCLVCFEVILKAKRDKTYQGTIFTHISVLFTAFTIITNSKKKISRNLSLMVIY